MYVQVNAAVSADGKLSSRRREQIPISGEADFARVDGLRRERDAILIGVGTVLADNPTLTLDEGGENRDEPEPPMRVVADSGGRTPTDANILDGSAPTVIFVAETAPADRRSALEDRGATIIEAGSEQVDLPIAFEKLATRSVSSLLVEGGGELLYSVFAEGLADRLTLYVGSVLIGGRDAPTLVDGEGWVESFPSLSLEEVRRIDDGVLLDYAVP